MKYKYLTGIVIGIVIVFIVLKNIRNRIKIEKNKEYVWGSDNKNIKTDFINVITTNPNLNYLIFEFKNYYIQYMGWENSGEFYCETISNQFLTDSDKLSKDQIGKLLNLNFSEPNNKDFSGNISPNYSKYYNSESKKELENIFNELTYIISEVYNISENCKINIRYDINSKSNF